MISLKIYDPAMCCETGVCGSSVDEKLIQIAGFLKALDPKKFRIERYNLMQDPAAYVKNKAVNNAMQEKGVEILPLFFVNDEIVFSGEYPSITKLEQKLGIQKPMFFSPVSNCNSEEGCC